MFLEIALHIILNKKLKSKDNFFLIITKYKYSKACAQPLIYKNKFYAGHRSVVDKKSIKRNTSTYIAVM